MEAEEKEKHEEEEWVPRSFENIKIAPSNSNWEILWKILEYALGWWIIFHGYIWRWSSKANEVTQDESNSTWSSWPWDPRSLFVSQTEGSLSCERFQQTDCAFLRCRNGCPHLYSAFNSLFFHLASNLIHWDEKRGKNYPFSQVTRNVHRMLANWLSDVVKYFCSKVYLTQTFYIWADF